MDLQTLISFIGFAFVSSITPGPNNLMLLASGMNYGFRRSIPHMLGIGIGFMILILVIGLGLGEVFERFAWVEQVMKVAAVIYLSYLAYKIATASKPKGEVSGKPFTFLQAALFQWVNPKAWAMALSAITVYTDGGKLHLIFFVSIVFALINIPCITSWAVLGQQMRKALDDPKILRIFNITMALLLIGSLYPVLK